METNRLSGTEFEWSVVGLWGTQPRWPLVKERNVCGRISTCDVVLPSTAISREHFVIHCRFGGCYLEDLNSRAGTYLNVNLGNDLGLFHPDFGIFSDSSQIKGLTPLRVGDVFGQAECFLRLERGPSWTGVDWSECQNSQELLLAIRGTPAGLPRRFGRFVDLCLELLEPDGPDSRIPSPSQTQKESWSAAAELARLVIRRATYFRMPHFLKGKPIHDRDKEDPWQICQKTEAKICQRIRMVF